MCRKLLTVNSPERKALICEVYCFLWKLYRYYHTYLAAGDQSRTFLFREDSLQVLFVQGTEQRSDSLPSAPQYHCSCHSPPKIMIEHMKPCCSSLEGGYALGPSGYKWVPRERLIIRHLFKLSFKNHLYLVRVGKMDFLLTRCYI